MIEADHVILPTRMAALILLLYGIPIRRIAEPTIGDIEVRPAGTPTARIACNCKQYEPRVIKRDETRYGDGGEMIINLVAVVTASVAVVGVSAVATIAGVFWWEARAYDRTRRRSAVSSDRSLRGDRR
ncbi:hypothetical protein [Skermania sp. ID1734]|uniref:hypothetical protein n=1 Tax=Skermania sp. ID1734 TaxID=2597516 RepID=UPI001181255F|nr:hypothetical protein [Skermania sp. ID1734]